VEAGGEGVVHALGEGVAHARGDGAVQCPGDGEIICFLVSSLASDQLFFCLEISFAGAVACEMSIPSVTLNCKVHTGI
jgi:hypothetical protein